MNILLLLTHPNPDSLNGNVAKELQTKLTDNGHQVRFKNLAHLDFDPELGMKDFTKWGEGQVPNDVKQEQEDISWAEGLVFVYPNWWNARPAKLKGWIDRVLTKGFAWDFTPEGLDGKLAGKKAYVAVTNGSPKELYDGLGISKERLHDHMIKGTLNFCGITDVKLVDTFAILTDPENAPKEHFDEAVREGVAFFGKA